MRQYNINTKQGIIDGFYCQANNDLGKFAIIVNGLNGFATYGMFPRMQIELKQKGISSIAFNFSHGGVRGSNDLFTEPELYEKNSMRLEVLDILSVVNSLKELEIEYKELYLISHSLGSIPTTFAGNEIYNLGKKLIGIAFIAPSMNLDFWGEENMQKWETDGFLNYDNKRTNQTLRLGKEFLEETKQSSSTWNIEIPISKTPIKYSIYHGDRDESIPLEEAYTVKEWITKNSFSCELNIIPNANHNFNITHPFKEVTPEFESLINLLSNWILF